MKISARVKTGKKKEGIEKINGNNYVVFVKEQPIEGKANKAAIKLLADYFKISVSQISIVSGHTSKQKIIEVYEKS